MYLCLTKIAYFLPPCIVNLPDLRWCVPQWSVRPDHQRGGSHHSRVRRCGGESQRSTAWKCVRIWQLPCRGLRIRQVLHSSCWERKAGLGLPGVLTPHRSYGCGSQTVLLQSAGPRHYMIHERAASFSAVVLISVNLFFLIHSCSLRGTVSGGSANRLVGANIGV